MIRARIQTGPIAGGVVGVLIALAGGCASSSTAPTSRPIELSGSPTVAIAPSGKLDAALSSPVTRPRVSASQPAVTPLLTAAAEDPAWQFAPQIDGLVPPLNGNVTSYDAHDPMPLPTQVRLLWDAHNLYVRITCVGPKPYSPFGNKRDAKQYQGDAVEVFLDPMGDQRQYFEIQVSAANGVLDQNTLVTTEPKNDPDGALTHEILMSNYWPNLGYDIAGLRTATSVAGDGDQTTWITDIAIPADAVMHRLNTKTLEPRTVRMNFVRYHWLAPVEDKSRTLHPLNWSPTRWGCPHQSPAAMGYVDLK